MDGGAHRGGDGNALEEDAFRRGGLRLLYGFNEDTEVFDQCFGIHGGFTDCLVKVGSRIVLEGDFAFLNFFNDLFNVWTNGIRLWVWHETGWTKDLRDLRELRHHVWSRNGDVTIDLTALRDFIDEIFTADNVGSGFFRILFTISGNERHDFLGFADGVREEKGSADLLVAFLHIDTEVDVDFDGRIKLRFCRLFDEFHRVSWGIKLLCINELLELLVAFAAGHR